jgi:hypothetical protein
MNSLRVTPIIRGGNIQHKFVVKIIIGLTVLCLVGAVSVNAVIGDVTVNKVSRHDALGTVAPPMQWQQTFGGSGNSTGRSVQQTPDGGYIIVGNTAAGANKYDVYLVKTDTSGKVQWQQTFGGSGNSTGRSVQQTPDGGYIVVGSTEEAGKTKVYLVKTDLSGNKQWQQTFGGGLVNVGAAVQQTGDGGYVVFATTVSESNALAYLFKTDASGKMQWEHYYSGNGNAVATSGRQTTDGGYIIAGSTLVSGANKIDAYLAKTDSSGNKEWEETYAGSKNSTAYAVTHTKDGGYAFFGTTDSFGAGGLDAYLVKTDSSGNMQWERTFGGSGDDIAFDGQQTGDGGYVMAGSTNSFGVAKSNVYLVKTDSTGSVLWQQNFGGSGTTIGYAVQQTTDGGYITVGATDSFSANKLSVYLVKVQPDATPTPTPTPTPPPTPVPLSITSVQMVPGYPQYLEWDLSNTGNIDVFTAPNSQFYKPIATAPGYAKLGSATVLYAYDSTTKSMITVYQYGGNGWFNALAGHNYRVFSGPVVPADAKWAIYNAQLFYNGAFQGSLYSDLHYSVLQ